MGLDQYLYKLNKPNYKVKSYYDRNSTEQLYEKGRKFFVLQHDRLDDKETKYNFDLLSNVGVKSVVNNDYINYLKCIRFKHQEIPESEIDKIKIHGYSYGSNGYKFSATYEGKDIDTSFSFEEIDNTPYVHESYDEEVIFFESEEIHYWRKLYMLKDWVNEHTNTGDTNCMYIPLNRDDIEELIQYLTTQLKNNNVTEIDRSEVEESIQFFNDLLEDQSWETVYYYDWW